MAIIMTAAAVVAFLGLRPGVQEEAGESGADPVLKAAGEPGTV
jgi:hypothetical protein